MYVCKAACEIGCGTARSRHSPRRELTAIEPTALYHYVSTVASRIDSTASLDAGKNLDNVHRSGTSKAEHASRVADIVCNAMDGDDVRVLRSWFERFGPLLPGQCRSVARLGSESLSLYRGHAMVTAAAVAGWKAGAEAAARTAAAREMAQSAEAREQLDGVERHLQHERRAALAAQVSDHSSRRERDFTD